MKKLIRNIYNLLSISTPYFIIFNYIKNYFPNYRKKKQCLKIDKEIYLGDIILNYYKIDKNSFKQDFDRLWIHGFLHLLGYKHKKDKDFSEMNKLENILIEKLKK